MKCAVFISGNGSNLQAIINAGKKRKMKATVALVVSDNKKAYGLKRAEKAKIKSAWFDRKLFTSRADFEKEILKALKNAKIDFIVLAGFMRIISPLIVKRYKGKVLNIHPALLPSFRGAHAIDDAYHYGVKVTGVTIHFVDEKVDQGPIIMQEAISLKPKETRKALEARIHALEHKLYPKAIDLFARGKLRIAGRKVIIT